MRMLITDIRIALTSLKATKVRTALTILGVVIGVACITTVLTLGEGAKQAVGSQLSKLGESVITVRPGQAERDASGQVTNYNLLSAIGATTITERDFESIKAVPNTKAAPLMVLTGSVKNGVESARGSQILASNSELDDILNFKLTEGDDFLDASIDPDTAVIGSDLADRLFDTQNALGSRITLRGEGFTVVGILEKTTATSLSGIDLNNAAFIGMDSGKKFNQGIVQIQQVFIRAEDSASVDAVARTVHDTLLKNHNGEEDFAVLTPDDSQQIAGSTLSIVTNITSAIAAISIIVGGIGIMNIMLVSVTERVREIGIRKSIGATDLQVLRQFLIEATVMSIVGGIIGVALAYAVAFVIAIQFSFFPVLNLQIFLIALGVSIVTGLIFGSWPAIRAARKDPIEALRQY